MKDIEKRTERYVTNLDKSIFALQNLSEVVKGALFSRYSRSNKSLRQVLNEEFIEDTSPEDNRAEEFYDRVLGAYGDDSIAELGGAHIACEGVSNIAAKALEDNRLGISPLEKSTRYVLFDRRSDGTYPYYCPQSIMDSPHKELYLKTLDNLFQRYNGLYQPLMLWICDRIPKDEITSDRAYQSAIKAKALDLLRGLLPMATLTNVGLYGNGLAFEHLLVKLHASSFEENRAIAHAMQTELDKVIPSFVKRVKTERGRQAIRYLEDTQQQTKQMTAWIERKYQPEISWKNGCARYENQSKTYLVDFDPAAEEKVVAAILFANSSLTMREAEEVARKMSRPETVRLLKTYVGDRENRRNRPGRAFEETYYTFDVVADIGAYRDLQRHRVLTQERQNFTTTHGYVIPPELKEAGVVSQYYQALDEAAECYEVIRQDFPVEAQYVVPFAYRVRWKMKFNLREAFHLLELRSQRQGHPSYRAIAQSMYLQIKLVHPLLAAAMTWVDLGDYDLERLASEQRFDARKGSEAT